MVLKAYTYQLMKVKVMLGIHRKPPSPGAKGPKLHEMHMAVKSGSLGGPELIQGSGCDCPFL